MSQSLQTWNVRPDGSAYRHCTRSKCAAVVPVVLNGDGAYYAHGTIMLNSAAFCSYKCVASFATRMAKSEAATTAA